MQNLTAHNISDHTFHIPVMGIAFTIDTPVKVARFGISSVVSIIQDILIEQMREYYCNIYSEKYISIPKEDIDHRAKRITAYLDLMQKIVDNQIEKMKKEPFEEGTDIVKYFKMLPDGSPTKTLYDEMIKMEGLEKELAQAALRERVVPGSIDVNIMTKIDNLQYSKEGKVLPVEFSDASAAFRGFANSTLQSSVVFSAGLNPRLYAYIEKFADFYPDENGFIRKKIILKVSDYRSAIIQGKYLAKKGLWISEFRIESGLNCGGHAFPTEGHLLGPILEEFKTRKGELAKELREMCNQALNSKNRRLLSQETDIRITVQGGIGTSNEDKFLLEHYNLDGTGWGSPFLMVPEATNVDDITLNLLVNAKQEDYYVSHASPLGVPFNNFRKSTGEIQRKERIERNRPGSPCHKRYLTFDTEFTERPICTSSREYQHKKLKSLFTDTTLPKDQIAKRFDEITEKDCLCEGLSSSVLIKNNMPDKHHHNAVTICPGPNLAYFTKVFSLEEMVDHIYGRTKILNNLYRPQMFIGEFKMYVDYLKQELDKNILSLSDKQAKCFTSFKSNLLLGIEYYKNLLPKMTGEAEEIKSKMKEEIEALRLALNFKIEATV